LLTLYIQTCLVRGSALSQIPPLYLGKPLQNRDQKATAFLVSFPPFGPDKKQREDLAQELHREIAASLNFRPEMGLLFFNNKPDSASSSHRGEILKLIGGDLTANGGCSKGNWQGLLKETTETFS
jgi:hypothetical protein